MFTTVSTQLTDDVRTVITQCARLLVQAGVARGTGISDEAQALAVCEHEVLLLLSQLCGVSPGQIQAVAMLGGKMNAICTDDQIVQFSSWLWRRKNREPLQHIMGHAPFRFLDLDVGHGVFIPRPETELLVDDALEFVHTQKMEAPIIVDLCAGSGALGLAAATEIPDSTVYAVELFDEAFAYAQRNVYKVGAERNYTLIQGDATNPQILEDINGTVDIVLSNPPYVPQTDIPTQTEVREFDPESALYGGSSDGMLIPQKIMKRAYDLLKSGGLLVMEHDWQQGSVTRECAHSVGFVHTVTKQDLAKKDRYLYALK